MVNDDKLHEIKQNWWHIEEIYHPTDARIIRQVMDLFTDQSQILIELNDEFVGLKAIARNSSNCEIAFLEYSNIIKAVQQPKTEQKNQNYLNILRKLSRNLMKSLQWLLNRQIRRDIFDTKTNYETTSIVLNLTNLNSFPSIPNEFKDPNNLYGYNHRHVRIEIQYILINPKIAFLERKETLLKLIDKIWNKIFPKRTSTIVFKGITQAEIYITLPLGWKMCGGNIFQRIFRSLKSTEGYSIGMKCFFQKKYFTVNFCKPFIKLNNGKRTYNYIIHPDDYLKLKKIESDDLISEFTYRSQISYTVALISIIPFIILLLFSIYISSNTSSYYTLHLFKIPISLPIINSSIAIGISILLLTFSVFDYNLIREGYDIPHKYWHLIILFISIFSCFVFIYIDIHVQDLQNTNSMVTNFYKQFFIFIK